MNEANEIFSKFYFLFRRAGNIRAYNKADDRSRINLDWLIVDKQGEVARNCCVNTIASKVAEARKLRSRHFPVSVREGRGRRTADQIHRVRRNAIATSMLYKWHSPCMTNVRLKHFADTIYKNPARYRLINFSCPCICETFNSPAFTWKLCLFFHRNCQLSLKHVD